MEPEDPPEFIYPCGGVVLGDSGTIALIQNRDGDGSWLFPKGRPDQGETDEETARREIAEETGLHNLELLDDLGTFDTYHIKKEGGYSYSEPKRIHMFLFAAEPHSVLAPTMEIGEAKWFPYREVATVLGDEKARAWFATVANRVQQAIQRD